MAEAVYSPRLVRFAAFEVDLQSGELRKGGGAISHWMWRLSTFMVNDLPDPARFFKVGSDLIVGAAKAATGEHPRVAACGECGPTLWAQGKVDAAIQLEHLWDEIAKRYDVDILCGYVLKSFRREESHIYQKICAEHSAVYSQ